MAQAGRVQSPLLVGRDDLLALITRRIGEAKGGHGNLVTLAGEAGIGKSRLLRAALQHAAGEGFRVARGDLSPQDQLVSLASIHDLARSMHPGSFGTLGQDLLDLRGGKGADSLASRRILVHEIAERINDDLDRATVLAFEDLQWADELSLEVVGEVARLGRDRRLFMIAAYRLDGLPTGSIHREWRARLVTQRLAEELRLERLTYADTALVTSLIIGTGLPAPREVAQAVYGRTNGIPLHIEELIAALGDAVESDGRAIRDALVPDTIEDAVLARIRLLSEDARAVARAGAVIGRCFVPEVLAGIMDRPIGDLDAPLQELVDHAFLFPFDSVDLGYYDFRHQLLRDALYRTVPAPELRRLHARAAEFGTTLVGATEVHASVHLERAGLRRQAFEAALTGAQAAMAVTSRYEAFELYRRAVSNMPDELPPAEKAAVYDGFADAALAMDDIKTIEEASTKARQLHLEAGDALGAARALYGSYVVLRRDVRPRSERERLLRQVAAEFEALPEGPDRTSWLAEVATDQAMLDLDLGRLADARAALRRAGAMRAEAGQGTWDARFFGAIAEVMTGQVETGLAAMLEAARDARDAKAEGTGVTAYRMAAALAIRVMEYPTAGIGLVEGLRYADEIEQSYCRNVMAATSALAAWAAGRWDDAVRDAELELVEHGSRRASLGARDCLAFVALGRGNVDRARALLDQSLAISRPAHEVDLILPAIWGLAETALVDADPARALDHCEEAFELAQGTGERPLLVPFIVTGVRAALADRRPEHAERWLSRVRPFVADWAMARPAIAHAEGLLRLSAGSLVAARALLEDAVSGWTDRGRTWESLWARVDLATALLRSSRFVEGVRVLDEARATAEDLGSRPLLDRIAEHVRLARGRSADAEAWYPLTIREFEVAKQIAAGMTNAQIAAELFVSPKTVSAHVEHILAKLGAGRRAEIATWVASVAQAVA